ncbi:hypothetical protein JTB14_034759 [Gonioctena quinquepunctata]|nr:hypothetical protein JTB14_034759 [Gonioctena quinquepunctata]
MNGEDFTGSEKSYIQIHEEPSHDTFLSILDDKNTVIEVLERQVQNQKMQLLYYLQRDRTQSKLMELSETCSNGLLDENIPIVLAMGRFRKECGMKSNVHNLYEHMRCIDEKLVSTLRVQEFILRKIVKKLFQFLKNPNRKMQIKLECGRLFQNDFCLDLFNRVLEATLILKRKLESFRICCNRLIVIEDERNFIAEQVISLPVDQKMTCNYIMNIQMENNELEKRVKNISDQQGMQMKEMEELNVVERKLSNLQKLLCSTTANDTEISSIRDTVRNLEFEAKLLLEMTKRYKVKNEMEKANAKSLHVLILNKFLHYMRLAIDDEDLEERHSENMSDLELFDRINKPIQATKEKIRQDLERTNFECDSLKKELNKVLLERNELKMANFQLQRDMDGMKSSHLRELEILRQQRDTYITQVGDLETIREAYSHLVGKQIEVKPSILLRNSELLTTNMKLRREMKILNDIVDKQNKEISLQSDFIRHMKIYSENKMIWDNTSLEYSHKRMSRMSSNRNNGTSEKVIERKILLTEEVFNCGVDENINVVDSDQESCITSEFQASPPKGCSTPYSQDEEVLKEKIETAEEQKQSIADTTSSFTLGTKPSSEKEEKKMKISEDDLMCDCSFENTASICQPVKRWDGHHSSKEGTYPRNIQAVTDGVIEINPHSGYSCSNLS